MPGGYERYFEIDGKEDCYILGLEKGYPVESDLTSVTVISAKSGLLTDFLSNCVLSAELKH
ncbi:MAG: FAD:protein FMN transferase [Ruminococcus sp.]|nr:FAD:protein FMN transferase [Ruminococcus sp.]